MRKFFARNPKSEKGAAAIEFALLLPLLLLFFFGMAVYSDYVMVSRKIENAANDVAAIIAKEGRIAQNQQNVCTFNSYTTGGAAFLRNSFNTLLPIIIYPLNFTNGAAVPLVYDFSMVMAGRPLWSKMYADNDNNPATAPVVPNIDTTNMRVMWAENRGIPYTASIVSNATSSSFSRSAGEPPLFTISHNQEGQSYIMFEISYPFNQGGYVGSITGGYRYANLVIGNDINFSAVNSLRKVAAYPVRPKAINQNGNLITFNDANICTDCVIRSNGKVGAAGPLSACRVNGCGCSGNFNDLYANVCGCIFD